MAVELGRTVERLDYKSHLSRLFSIPRDEMLLMCVMCKLVEPLWTLLHVILRVSNSIAVPVRGKNTPGLVVTRQTVDTVSE